jgi:hypothetical protein
VTSPKTRRIVAALVALPIALGGVALTGCGDEADEADERAQEQLDEAQRELDKAQEELEEADFQKQLEEVYERGQKKAP